MDLNEILSRLEGVHGSGKQYSARCPAHDDKRASLSVSVGENGKVLFCGTDVARALGYAKPNDAVSRHCRATVKRSSPISGKMQEINFIPEGDVYRLITHSKLPYAAALEKAMNEKEG